MHSNLAVGPVIASAAMNPAQDELDRAQLRLLELWKDKQMVSHRLLSYDTTNFYTFVASSNERNTFTKKGGELGTGVRSKLPLAAVQQCRTRDQGLCQAPPGYRGSLDAEGIEEYLILLSICPTCKCSGLDFLDFLRSSETDIGAFAAGQQNRRGVAGMLVRAGQLLSSP